MPNPLCTITSDKEIKISNIDKTPYSSGAKMRAKIIDTTNDDNCAPHLSANFQKKDLIIVLPVWLFIFLLIFYTFISSIANNTSPYCL